MANTSMARGIGIWLIPNIARAQRLRIKMKSYVKKVGNKATTLKRLLQNRSYRRVCEGGNNCEEVVAKDSMKATMTVKRLLQKRSCKERPINPQKPTKQRKELKQIGF